MHVISLRAFRDNYVFILADEAEHTAAVVDPGDAAPVLRALSARNLTLTAILNTHHHRDHTGGNQDLLDCFPGIPVVGGALDRGRLPGQTVFAEDGETFEVAGRAARVLTVPGHTRGHVAYFVADGAGGDLFSGDTVFGGTIGNLFEGTPDEMFASIAKIRALPPATRIWCAHEYTRQYIREAEEVDPDNQRLAARVRALAASAPAPTIPLSLEEECATNPFFRWDAPELRRRLGTQDDLTTFRKLCEVP